MDVDLRLLKQTVDPHKLVGVVNMAVFAHEFTTEGDAVMNSLRIGAAAHRDRLGFQIASDFLIGLKQTRNQR